METMRRNGINSSTREATDALLSTNYFFWVAAFLDTVLLVLLYFCRSFLQEKQNIFQKASRKYQEFQLPYSNHLIRWSVPAHLGFVSASQSSLPVAGARPSGHHAAAANAGFAVAIRLQQRHRRETQCHVHYSRLAARDKVEYWSSLLAKWWILNIVTQWTTWGQGNVCRCLGRMNFWLFSVKKQISVTWCDDGCTVFYLFFVLSHVFYWKVIDIWQQTN